MTTPTLDQVIDLAHRLPREQRGQLIARLALELASDSTPARDGSNCTVARLAAKFTAAWATPGTCERRSSIRAAQAAQLIPSMGRSTRSTGVPGSWFMVPR